MDESTNSRLKSDELPRPGSVVYNLIYRDLKSQRKTLQQFRFINRYLVIPLYRLRILSIFCFGKIFLLLYHIGRKSGSRRITPLEYFRLEGNFYIFSGRGKKAHWFKNICANPDQIKVLIGFRTFEVNLEVINDLVEKEKIMRQYIKLRPKPAKTLIGWKPDEDDLETIDLNKILKIFPVIKINRKISTGKN